MRLYWWRIWSADTRVHVLTYTHSASSDCGEGTYTRDTLYITHWWGDTRDTLYITHRGEGTHHTLVYIHQRPIVLCTWEAHWTLYGLWSVHASCNSPHNEVHTSCTEYVLYSVQANYDRQTQHVVWRSSTAEISSLTCITNIWGRFTLTCDRLVWLL